MHMSLVFKMMLISCYSALDGTALRQSREYNSDYAWVQLYSTLANIIGPLIAGVLIKDPPDGSDEQTDYRLVVYQNNHHGPFNFP